jgi:hypothetical protein
VNPTDVGVVSKSCENPNHATRIPHHWNRDEDEAFIVAAVNVVVPLAEDWTRLKRIEEAARDFFESKEGDAEFYLLRAALDLKEEPA